MTKITHNMCVIFVYKTLNNQPLFKLLIICIKLSIISLLV